MYFTPRDLINFKASGKFKFSGNSQPPLFRRLEDNSYIVAQSPANVPNSLPSTTMNRRNKLQQTIFKPGPKLKKPTIVSRSVNTNILESSFDHVPLD